MVFANVLAEENILKIIAQKKDITLMSTLNEEWLTEERQNLLNVFRMKVECLDFFYCEQFCEENNIAVGFPLIKRIFKDEIDNELQPVMRILEEKYLIRKVHAVGDYILSSLEFKHKHPLLVASKAEEELMKLKYSGEKLEKLGDNFDADLKDLVDVGNIGGMNDLCLSKQEIMILGGERGHQKTNFALHIAHSSLEHNVIHLKNEKFKVLFFSREMAFRAIKARIISRLFRIPFIDVRHGRYNKKEIEAIFAEKYWFYNDNFIVVPPEKISSVEDVAKFILQEKPTIWLFDYMQLLARSISGKDGDVNSIIAWLITRFKSLAQLTDTLGIVISTLSKYEKGRVSRIPRLEDLYSSVEIQYLATWIGLCYWCYSYDKSCPMEYFFVLWQKNRNEEPYNDVLKVNPKYSTFENFPPTTPISTFGKYLQD